MSKITFEKKLPKIKEPVITYHKFSITNHNPAIPVPHVAVHIALC